MSELFEIFMIVCFGASWPLNVLKSYRARTTKGKSLGFLILIFIGYICGIASKLIAQSFKWYVVFFYVLNLIMVGTDLILYFRNLAYDRKEEAERKALAG
ncbi:MAG: hypothetical protein ACOX22_05985 [Caldicoprobacterales bacterium]|jgi:bacteriorhodopsin|nr:hypothetical protein [Clostridiales bacterium]